MNPSNYSRTWKTDSGYLRKRIPVELHDWLLDPASLTLRLQQLCPGKFSVRVLSQTRGRPRLDEARELGVRPDIQCMLRTVQLLCGDKPWIYARTVIPVTSLRGKLQQLTRLGSRPLGAMLFADPGMQRGRVQLACVQPGEPLFRDVTTRLPGRNAEIWGRRSVFRIAHRPLLVSEFFLPGFPASAAGRPRGVYRC